VLPLPAQTCWPVHIVPQPPQLVAVVMLVSQPCNVVPVQCVKPGAHEDRGKVHIDDEHDVGPVTFGRFVQSMPHPPQLWGSLVGSVTQPPSQSKPLQPVLPSDASSEPESLVGADASPASTPVDESTPDPASLGEEVSAPDSVGAVESDPPSSAVWSVVASDPPGPAVPWA
jgi:hypothetical protein